MRNEFERSKGLIYSSIRTLCVLDLEKKKQQQKPQTSDKQARLEIFSHRTEKFF